MIRITSKKDGFRRAGIAHSSVPADYPDDRFTQEQLATLKAEPMLIVLWMPDEKPADEKPVDEKPVKKPSARKKQSVLSSEAGMYLGLLNNKTGMPSVPDGEVTGLGYVRMPVELDEHGQSTTAVTFPQAMAAWGHVPYAVIMDRQAGGSVQRWGLCSPAIFVPKGTRVTIPAGAVMTLDDAGIDDDGLLYFPFSFGDATPKNLMVAENGKHIVEVGVFIQTPFNGEGASPAVGDTAQPERLMPTAGNIPGASNTCTAHPNHSYGSDTQVMLTINPGTGATRGAGLVMIQMQD